MSDIKITSIFPHEPSNGIITGKDLPSSKPNPSVIINTYITINGTGFDLLTDTGWQICSTLSTCVNGDKNNISISSPTEIIFLYSYSTNNCNPLKDTYIYLSIPDIGSSPVTYTKLPATDNKFTAKFS